MLITYNLRADSKSLNGNLSYRDSFWMRKKSILNKITTVCRRQKEVIISKDSQIKVGSKNSIFIFKQKVVVFITKITYLYANKILACTSIFLKNHESLINFWKTMIHFWIFEKPCDNLFQFLSMHSITISSQIISSQLNCVQPHLCWTWECLAILAVIVKASIQEIKSGFVVIPYCWP